VVLGSSDGWIPLYAGAALSTPVTGYELMPSRAQQAQRLSAMFDAELSQRIRYVEGDALLADISGAALLYITSCEWDQALVDAVHQKILREAAPGTLIIANDFLEVASPEVRAKFKLVAEKSLAVSWSDTELFAMYSVARGDEPAGGSTQHTSTCHKAAHEVLHNVKRSTYTGYMQSTMDKAVPMLSDMVELLFQPKGIIRSTVLPKVAISDQVWAQLHAALVQAASTHLKAHLQPMKVQPLM